MKIPTFFALSVALTFGNRFSFKKSVARDILRNFDWNAYKNFAGKTFENAKQEMKHINTFRKNMKIIDEHNERFAKGEETYELGISSISDLPAEEYEKLNGLRIPANYKRTGRTFVPPLNSELPQSIDWRNYGYVTEVKNQGSCGSCWSFSATGALEGQHMRISKKLVSLSEQNLVDCSSDYGNLGCNGGLMDYAFEYIKDNGGIDTEKEYSYVGTEGGCKYSKKFIGANCTGFVDLPVGDENALKLAVATVGPISVAIDASSVFFQLYKKGVYYNKNCSKEVNHGVLLVGYGTDKKSGDYWIVKNSWGAHWGMDGYILMARNRDDHCGITQISSYPTIF